MNAGQLFTKKKKKKQRGGQKTMDDNFKALKEKKNQPKMLCSAEIYFKNEGSINFQIKEK